MLAVNAILDRRPDYVFSGINHGGNMGEDVSYSGTVSAAMEGTLLGIPSVAVSLVHADESWLEGYESVVRRLARRITESPVQKLFPSDTLLNVNLPDRDPATVEGAVEPGGWTGLVYYRLHGSPRMYYSAYDGAALAALSGRLEASQARGIPSWCVFDNTAAGAALGNALELSLAVA